MSTSAFGCASMAYWALFLLIELFLNALVECGGTEPYRTECKAGNHHAALVVLGKVKTRLRNKGYARDVGRQPFGP